jgi:hypothetical protein
LFSGLLSFPCAAYGGVPAFVCRRAAKGDLMFLISDNGATGNDAVRSSGCCHFLAPPTAACPLLFAAKQKKGI